MRFDVQVEVLSTAAIDNIEGFIVPYNQAYVVGDRSERETTSLSLDENTGLVLNCIQRASHSTCH